MELKAPVLVEVIGVLMLCAGSFLAGKHVASEDAPKPTTIMCISSNALDGRGYFVDLTQPLFDQNCATHESFPGKILCQRMVTIECELP